MLSLPENVGCGPAVEQSSPRFTGATPHSVGRQPAVDNICRQHLDISSSMRVPGFQVRENPSWHSLDRSPKMITPSLIADR